MLNTIIINGRLTKDPELRYTQTQKPVASYTLAVERDYQRGGAEKQTDFINCVSWNQGAEFVSSHFKKGQLMTVKGSLQSRKWTDKAGTNRTEWEIIVDNAYFCGDKPKTDQPVLEEIEEDGELPF